MKMARAKTERDIQWGVRTERIAMAVGVGALLVTLAIALWMAATIQSVVSGDPQGQMWLVGHRFIRPVAIALIMLVWLVENVSGPLDLRSALTCALFVLGVVILDAGTWALIQAGPAGPVVGSESGGGPGVIPWCYSPFPFPGTL
jgi:hypothetical protein